MSSSRWSLGWAAGRLTLRYPFRLVITSVPRIKLFLVDKPTVDLKSLSSRLSAYDIGIGHPVAGTMETTGSFGQQFWSAGSIPVGGIGFEEHNERVGISKVFVSYPRERGIVGVGAVCVPSSRSRTGEFVVPVSSVRQTAIMLLDIPFGRLGQLVYSFTARGGGRLLGHPVVGDDDAPGRVDDKQRQQHLSKQVPLRAARRAL